MRAVGRTLGLRVANSSAKVVIRLKGAATFSNLIILDLGLGGFQPHFSFQYSIELIQYVGDSAVLATCTEVYSRHYGRGFGGREPVLTCNC